MVFNLLKKTTIDLDDDFPLNEEVETKEEETEEIEIKAEFDYGDDEEEISTKKRKTVKKRARKIKEEIKHAYIPKHEILDPNTLEKLILEENFNPEKLPFIFINDPGIAHLEVKPGDVVKITRKNKTIGDVLYYRKIISP